MKLSELKSILQFDTDFADTEIDASFYTELEDILSQYADELVVHSISTNYIVCNFYDFIFNHQEEITKYIKAVYLDEDLIDYKIAGIFNNQDADCIAHFIEHDMDDFLRGDY